METFENMVRELNERPDEQCVIRRLYLADLGIDPSRLAAASDRDFVEQPEEVALPDRHLSLRDMIVVFAPKMSRTNGDTLHR